jgi:predicted RecB family endonuclease
MGSGNDNVMALLQQVLDNHLHALNRRFESLESQVQEVLYCVRNLQQDTSETLTVLEEVQSNVESNKKSLRKTNSFVRRISQNLNRPNDFSGTSHHKKSQYGSTDSIPSQGERVVLGSTLR